MQPFCCSSEATGTCHKTIGVELRDQAVPRMKSSLAASANVRKSRSRVSSTTCASIQLCAINASPRRALRRFPSTFARKIPARCQKPTRSSMWGTCKSISETSEGNSGSLNSSVRTTGTITTRRSASARSSNSASSPVPPSRKATHVLVSAAITELPIGFQFGSRTRKANLPSKLPQAGIRPGSRNKLQTGAHGLRDAGPTGKLRFLEKVLWNFYCDLTRGIHGDVILPYSLPALNMVNSRDSTLRLRD
jgi:hypothetical protein